MALADFDAGGAAEERRVFLLCFPAKSVRNTRSRREQRRKGANPGKAA